MKVTFKMYELIETPHIETPLQWVELATNSRRVLKSKVNPKLFGCVHVRDGVMYATDGYRVHYADIPGEEPVKNGRYGHGMQFIDGDEQVSVILRVIPDCDFSTCVDVLEIPMFLTDETDNSGFQYFSYDCYGVRFNQNLWAETIESAPNSKIGFFSETMSTNTGILKPAFGFNDFGKFVLMPIQEKRG